MNKLIIPSKTNRLFEKNPFLFTRGHDFVEIGGIKWATMNIGATGVTDTGLYFQWGDTQGYTASQVGSGSGQKYFGWADYKYNNGGAEPTAENMTKYNSSDGKTVLDASDDAVQAAWGGSWRMPTTEEFVALGAAVNSAWTADYQGSGVAGLVCSDKTDSSKVLFFPAAGLAHGGTVAYMNNAGFYLSKVINRAFIGYCYNLSFSKMNNTPGRYDQGRYRGQAIRGVLDI